MYATEYTKQDRAAPVAITVAIHLALIYMLATGLGVVPSILPQQPLTVVDVPVETVKPQPFEKPQLDSRDLTNLSTSLDMPSKPTIVIDTIGEPIIDEGPPLIDIGIDDSPSAMSTNARLLKKSEPPYPSFSRLSGEEGTVFVKVSISPYGVVGDALVEKSSGFPRLDEAALKAVRAWRFAPAMQGKLAIAEWVVVPVKYVLSGRG